MKKIVLLVAAISAASCATIYNGRETIIAVHTNEPVRVEANGTITSNMSVRHDLGVPRQWQPATLTLRNDSAEKTINVKSIPSVTYFYNFLWVWGFVVGMFIDMLTPKWRGYPRDVYVNMQDSGSTYYTYNIFEQPWKNHANAISITPLRLISVYYPSVEFSYQRRFTPNLATEFTAAFMLPKSGWQNTFYSSENDNVMNNIGFKVGVEQKFYLRSTAPHGWYVSGELNYLRTRYEQYYADYPNYGDLYYDLSLTPYNRYSGDWNRREDWFNVSMQMLTCNFKVGYQLFVEHFFIDGYIGLGLRYADVSHSNKETWNRLRTTGFFGHDELGKNFFVNMPFNFRLGWAF